MNLIKCILTESEREVFGEFLDRLAENMSNAGCNDMLIKDPQFQKAIADYHNSDDPSANVKPQLINHDWIVLLYLRKKLGL